jgi:leucyl aminopeptidase (aminopeptidase T)
MDKESLDKAVLPSLCTSVDELGQEIERILRVLKGAKELAIHTDNCYKLQLQLGSRPWLADDGYIDAADRAQGAIASNLPAGSVYTTVLEDRTHGEILISQPNGASVLLRFDHGDIVSFEATDATLAEDFSTMLNKHSGDCRRVGHIGIGLNPHLIEPIGWTLIDEHVPGALFLSLGENRYMGGQNQSSLNVDYTLPDATLIVDAQVIVEKGKLTVTG